MFSFLGIILFIYSGRGSFQATAIRRGDGGVSAKVSRFLRARPSVQDERSGRSETKGRESLVGTMASISSRRLGHALDHFLGDIPDGVPGAARVLPAVAPARDNFSPSAGVRIYQSHSG